MRPRVLYVDDHVDTCDLIRLVLARHGYHVSVASCSSEALGLAEDQEFDLYILDNRLPDSTGVELLGRLRESAPHTPAILYSGNGLEADRRRALEAGASEYLIKPAGPAELVEAVSRAIGG